jgi:ribosomal protein L14
MKTIRQSQIVRTLNGGGRCRVGDIVIFDVLNAAPRGSGATEAAARAVVRRGSSQNSI